MAWTRGRPLRIGFFGVFDPNGISAIRLGTDSGDWEMHHLQYGAQSPASVPEPTAEDAGTLLLRGEQTKSTVDANVNSTFPLFNSEKTQVWYDANGDVAGPGGVSTPDEESTSIPKMNGYESAVSGPSSLLYTRSFYNADGTVSVELAFDYLAFNQLCQITRTCTSLDPAFLPYLVFETNRGLKDNQSYRWNDKYNFDEAGSPYFSVLNPNGTQGIYELDNMRGSFASVPEPASMTLMGIGLMGIAVRLRSRRRDRHAAR